MMRSPRSKLGVAMVFPGNWRQTRIWTFRHLDVISDENATQSLSDCSYHYLAYQLDPLHSLLTWIYHNTCDYFYASFIVTSTSGGIIDVRWCLSRLRRNNLYVSIIMSPNYTWCLENLSGKILEIQLRPRRSDTQFAKCGPRCSKCPSIATVWISMYMFLSCLTMKLTNIAQGFRIRWLQTLQKSICMI